MKPLFLSLLLAGSFAGFGQTVTIPATVIPYNPSSNTITIPATTLTINPSSTPVPITIAALRAMNLHIVNVDYKSGVHEITGYNEAGTLVTTKVLFGLNNVLAVSRFMKPKLAIITIPFKVRGAVDTFLSKAQAGLTNVGLSLNLVNYKMDRYFSSGNKSTHTLSAGVFLAPNVEEIAPETTRNKVARKTSQLFLSTGISATYSYGDVSFIVVPVAFDFTTSSLGSKYIYNGRYWFGFGIGLSIKLFGLG